MSYWGERCKLDVFMRKFCSTVFLYLTVIIITLFPLLKISFSCKFIIFLCPCLTAESDFLLFMKPFIPTMSVSILSDFSFPIGLNPISNELCLVLLNSFITQTYQTTNLFLTINAWHRETLLPWFHCMYCFTSTGK